MKKFLCLISLFLLGVTLYASPITGLLERIDKGRPVNLSLSV